MDRLERIERAPLELSKLQTAYREERQALAGSFSKILEGAKERRAYFASLVPLGKEKLNEDEIHRLSRDSIRRRYEQEQASRRHAVRFFLL